MLIPLAILSLIAILLLLLSLRGRRIDGHPTCRRCKFDLIGLPAALCPECGANLEGPKAIRIGNRQRLRRLALFSCFLLLIGLAGSGLSIYGATRKIDWYTYKPVWWLRLDTRYGSQESVSHAINELLNRHDANKLSQSDVDAVVSTFMSAMESAHLPTPVTYGHALADLISSTHLSRQSHDTLINWILTLQADPAKPWSTELGTAFLNECAAKRIPDEQRDRFLKQTCTPQLQTSVKRPLRPGERIPLTLSLNPRGGSSFINLTFPSALSGPVLGSRRSLALPAPSVVSAGEITAPQEPGDYSRDATITAELTSEDPFARRLRSRASIRTPTPPQITLEWPVQLIYQVADSIPTDPLKDFAQRLFWVGDVQPELSGRGLNHSCTLYAVAPSTPMSVEFEVLWRYQGAETSIGSGSLDITPRGFSSSYKTQSARGSSSGGSSGGMKARPERYTMTIPNIPGPATTGTITIHITKLTFDNAPPEPLTPFDLEFPNIKVHW